MRPLAVECLQQQVQALQAVGPALAADDLAEVLQAGSAGLMPGGAEVAQAEQLLVLPGGQNRQPVDAMKGLVAGQVGAPPGLVARALAEQVPGERRVVGKGLVEQGERLRLLRRGQRRKLQRAHWLASTLRITPS